MMDELGEMIVKELAREFQIPESMLLGKTISLQINQNDVRRFYARTNAMLKGSRRRMRRFRAHLNKMARKGKIDHVLRRH